MAGASPVSVQTWQRRVQWEYRRAVLIDDLLRVLVEPSVLDLHLHTLHRALHGTAACCNSLQRACTVLQHVAKVCNKVRICAGTWRRHTTADTAPLGVRRASWSMAHGGARRVEQQTATNGYCPSCEERPSLSVNNRRAYPLGQADDDAHGREHAARHARVALKGPLGT